MDMAVDLSWWFQQRCSSLFVHQAMNSLVQHAWTSLSTTMFKLASSTMFKPVNNHVQAGQLNHVQACQQPCSGLSIGKYKMCVFTCVIQGCSGDWKRIIRNLNVTHFIQTIPLGVPLSILYRSLSSLSSTWWHWK